MEILKMISILLPVLVALSGAGFYLYGVIQEPDFSYGHCFTTAWIDYGVNQNTLNIEFVPDLQGKAVLAIREALIRVEAKADINPKIDGKPLLVILWIRDKTSLIEAGRFVVTSRENKVLLHGSQAERLALLDAIFDKAEVTFNETSIMVQKEGRVIFVPRAEANISPDTLIDEYLEHHYNTKDEELTYA